MTTEQFGYSNLLSESMDLLGYSLEMVKYRQHMNEKLDYVYNTDIADVTKVTIVTCGSKGEGIAKYFESDIDRLYVHQEVICKVATLEPIDKLCKRSPELPLTTFLSEPDGCSPGYTRLRLIELRNCRCQYFLQKSLVRKNGDEYLRNDFPKKKGFTPMLDISGALIGNQKRSGPSNSVGNRSISYDFVEGFVYDSKDYLEAWKARKRSHDWPSSDLVKAVLGTQGHVVPVSSKQTKYLKTEWRICFTEAELLLFKSLNEFHMKVFVLLKLVSKSTLKPICREITSYINKTVIFWMAENNPTSSFRKQTLFERFVDSLIYLRDSVARGTLQNYIINQRNLLSGRITSEQRDQLVSKIDQLLSKQEGLFKTLSVGRTLDAMADSLDELKTKNERRNTAERLLMEKNVIFKRLEAEWFHNDDEEQLSFEDLLAQDEEYKKHDQILRDFILPDIQEITEGGDDAKKKLQDRLQELLS